MPSIDPRHVLSHPEVGVSLVDMKAVPTVVEPVEMEGRESVYPEPLMEVDCIPPYAKHSICENPHCIWCGGQGSYLAATSTYHNLLQRRYLNGTFP